MIRKRVLVGLLLVVNTAYSDPVRIASWNLNNLHHISGEALRSRAPVRVEEDFAVLRQYVHRLDADVVALQEVNGPKAARRLFPESEYELYFSGRYEADLESARVSDRIYTGFAVRKNVFDSIVKVDNAALSVLHGKSRRPTRRGVELRIEKYGRVLYLLNLHLKSGCFRGNLMRPGNENCRTLARQIEPLETWIDQRTREGVPFIVLGDFNRAFDVYDEDDHLWLALDDGDPAGLELFRLPDGEASTCWRNTGLYHRHPVDFIVLNKVALSRMTAGSFTRFDYDPGHRDKKRRTPSDHCPVLIEYGL